MKINTGKLIAGWARFSIALCLISPFMVACSDQARDDDQVSQEAMEVTDKQDEESLYVEPDVIAEPSEDAGEAKTTEKTEDAEEKASAVSADALRDELNIKEDFRKSLYHGDKGASYQKYIMLHDTEGDSSPESVVSWWAGNGNLVAAQFVIGKDGTIVQCVPMDKIAHHAGYGDTGHNKLYGITEDGRDDMKASKPIGSWASDYGMNAWSIGIELVHVGGSGDYPKAQLEALDSLIAYIDAYYGFESEIIDHKAWRTGNSDTSKEFSTYLKNYQKYRTHDGK